MLSPFSVLCRRVPGRRLGSMRCWRSFRPQRCTAWGTAVPRSSGRIVGSMVAAWSARHLLRLLQLGGGVDGQRWRRPCPEMPGCVTSGGQLLCRCCWTYHVSATSWRRCSYRWSQTRSVGRPRRTKGSLLPQLMEQCSLDPPRSLVQSSSGKHLPRQEFASFTG